jgi:hypothetical protein
VRSPLEKFGGISGDFAEIGRRNFACVYALQRSAKIGDRVRWCCAAGAAAKQGDRFS